jgi:hypothetical protein
MPHRQAAEQDGGLTALGRREGPFDRALEMRMGQQIQAGLLEQPLPFSGQLLVKVPRSARRSSRPARCAFFGIHEGKGEALGSLLFSNGCFGRTHAIPQGLRSTTNQGSRHVHAEPIHLRAHTRGPDCRPFTSDNGTSRRPARSSGGEEKELLRPASDHTRGFVEKCRQGAGVQPCSHSRVVLPVTSR